MNAKRWEFFNHSDGSRVRVPAGKLSPTSLHRAVYRMHVRDITNSHELRATLRAGKYTSYGCYPVFLFMEAGACMCMDCARANYRELSQAIREGQHYGWRPVGCEVNYESTDLYCDDCGKQIESAYGESGNE